ncbi:MAG: FAD-dependent monooxygenase [Acidobacteria bacterium]|nr:FAD-dependent monooxygenase [Acidobacteriota bacterium]
MNERHAEIAGGGIGGLGLGLMLARKGWSVRIHERSPTIREVGAAISLRNNSISVLERCGAFEQLRAEGSFLLRERHFDKRGNLLQERATTGQRTMVLPRQSLVEGLAASARQAGVEIKLSSVVVSADPAGALIDDAGVRYPADLAVAADGLHSKIRTELGLRETIRELTTRINRYLVPTQEFTTPETKDEHWSGDRRVGFLPAGKGRSLIYTTMASGDGPACRLPLDVGNWTEAYPTLEPVFRLLRQQDTIQFSYPFVRCTGWHRGRVALIGDAAHAMPPTLGQGAGLTLMNSYALAELVSGSSDVATALRSWETAVREITEATQRWSLRYDRITGSLPRALNALRPHVIRTIGRFKPLYDSMRVADLGLPLIEQRVREASAARAA